MKTTRSFDVSASLVPNEYARLPVHRLVEQIILDMARCWRRGEPVRAKDYLRQYPWIAEEPEAVVQLIQEEICLGEKYHQRTDVRSILKLFPQWSERLEALIECDTLLKSEWGEPDYPCLGQKVMGWELLDELGVGTFSRTYLARREENGSQAVLKLVARCSREHKILGAIHHPHLPAMLECRPDVMRELRLLAFPDQGGTWLEMMMDLLQGGETLPAALDQTGRMVDNPSDSLKTRVWLESARYDQTVAWLGASLADALEQVHRAGWLHRDITPSSVFLTASAHPLLIDFDLAGRPSMAGDFADDTFGGTAFFMAPEMREAWTTAREGNRLTHTVDVRADVYSLSLVLLGILGDRDSELRPILEKGVQADPAARYSSAGELAQQLRGYVLGPWDEMG